MAGLLGAGLFVEWVGAAGNGGVQLPLNVGIQQVIEPFLGVVSRCHWTGSILSLAKMDTLSSRGCVPGPKSRGLGGRCATGVPCLGRQSRWPVARR